MAVDAVGAQSHQQDHLVQGFGTFGNDPRKEYLTEPYRQFGEPRIVGVTLTYDPLEFAMADAELSVYPPVHFKEAVLIHRWAIGHRGYRSSDQLHGHASERRGRGGIQGHTSRFARL